MACAMCPFLKASASHTSTTTADSRFCSFGSCMGEIFLVPPLPGLSDSSNTMTPSIPNKYQLAETNSRIIADELRVSERTTS